VQIRFGESEAAAEQAETVVELFKRVVSTYSDHTALAVKRAGEWKTWTYRDYLEEAKVVARAFIRVSF
jgi:long-subunit acyl-CoA synthetase (AMP-forming)